MRGSIREVNRGVNRGMRAGDVDGKGGGNGERSRGSREGEVGGCL